MSEIEEIAFIIAQNTYARVIPGRKDDDAPAWADVLEEDKPVYLATAKAVLSYIVANREKGLMKPKTVTQVKDGWNATF